MLYRQLPRVKRYLAYLPEGPLIDWSSENLRAWLDPMATHLKSQGAFGIRIGPPVVTRRWSAAQVKEGIADESVHSLTSRAPAPSAARSAPASSPSSARPAGDPSRWPGGFAAGQPQYNFQIPLVDAEGNHRTEDRRTQGHEPAVAPQHQEGRQGRRRGRARHARATSRPSTSSTRTPPTRDHFTPRPLRYFETMFEALGAEEPDRIRLYLARHEGDLVAATIWIRVGAHTWYSYGASSTEKRDVRGSNAVQWQMIRDSLAAGAHVYDLRGITDTLDSDDSHVGLIQFKVGTGGEAVEYAGEWDLPLNKPLYKAFDLYMNRRG